MYTHTHTRIYKCIYRESNAFDTVNLLPSMRHDPTIFVMRKTNTFTKSTLYSMLRTVDTELLAFAMTWAICTQLQFEPSIQRNCIYSICLTRQHAARLPLLSPNWSLFGKRTGITKGNAPQAQAKLRGVALVRTQSLPERQRETRWPWPESHTVH